MNKLRLAVLFGGVSSEYDVSLRSAVSILEHLDTGKYEITRVGITRDGRWYLFEGDNSLIAADRWLAGPVTAAALSPDRSVHGLQRMGGAGGTQRLDVIFPVLHGKNGEDGTVQGLAALAGIPCVGSGVLASAACMDKEFTHMVLSYHKIPNARFVCAGHADLDDSAPLLCRIREAGLAYPLFVKPANAGSSVGVTKAHTEQELMQALKTALHEDAKAVIEETITGAEVECAVMGNDTPIAAPYVGEIEPLRELYDYEGKYCDDSTAQHIPARIGPQTAEEIRETAVKAYRALGCRGLARVDFFVRGSDGAVILNEINTLPGFTSISMYPKLFCETPMLYSGLLDQLITFAIEPRRR